MRKINEQPSCIFCYLICNSLTILIVTVTLSAGPSGYVNLVVTSSCDTFDGETAGHRYCYMCTSPYETKKKYCALQGLHRFIPHFLHAPHPPPGSCTLHYRQVSVILQWMPLILCPDIQGQQLHNIDYMDLKC